MDKNINMRELVKSFNRIGGSEGTAELKISMF